MHRYLDDVTEREYHTMMGRLRTLEIEPIVENLYDWIDTETAILMDKLGIISGDVAPEVNMELDDVIRKIAGMIVDEAYQNIEKSLA